MTEGQEPAEDFANDRSKAPSSDPSKDPPVKWSPKRSRY